MDEVKHQLLELKGKVEQLEQEVIKWKSAWGKVAKINGKRMKEIKKLERTLKRERRRNGAV